jgi:hypothetical protein
MVTSDATGAFSIPNVPAGPVTLTARLEGFDSQRRDFSFDLKPVKVDFKLRVGGVGETVTVTGQTPMIDTQSATHTVRFGNDDFEPRKSAEAERQIVPPSQNVINLQKRAAGVLPVRIDVPRAGTSHRFVRPLVVDQETVVALRYKRR